METRNLIVALLGAMAVYVLWLSIYNTYLAPPPTTQPAAPPAAATTQPNAATGAPSPTAPAATLRSGQVYTFEPAETSEPFWLGTEQDAIRVRLDAIEASVSTILLTRRGKDGRYVHCVSPEGNDPYVLVSPVQDAMRSYNSFATRRLWLAGELVTMDGVRWKIVERDTRQAVFETTLKDADGKPLLRIRKKYALRPGKPIVDLDVRLENLTGQTLKVALGQDGPLGIPSEAIVYSMRRVVVGLRKPDGTITVQSTDAGKLRRAQRKGQPLKLSSLQDERRFVWTALTNKYFAVFTRPVVEGGDAEQVIADVIAELAANLTGTKRGDLLARLRTRAHEMAPGKQVAFRFEVYAGTKDREDLAAADPLYAGKLDYAAVQYADLRCCCEFLWLKHVMIGLLDVIHAVVPNYGVAIIVLVILVRVVLHPLAVFQQKSMYRAQEAMGRIQPKLQAIREKYANDRVKMNQEMMRVYSEEGVNPMAPMVGMIPMLIQMPILIALWRGISTDIHLRHAPFDGWWITDLSAPDALIRFGGDGLTIPILGWLPLIGGMFQNIPSLNLLPILMGISMWLQQKYMPKPQVEARLRAAREAQQKNGGSKSGGGLGSMSPEEQMRQQQMIANMMAVMFPLMFYYFPSGLNLYWMATNVFGIFESLRIRRQIEEERRRREALGPAATTTTRKKGIVGRWLEQMAMQAEQLQKRADELTRQSTPRSSKRRGEKRTRGGS